MARPKRTEPKPIERSRNRKLGYEVFKNKKFNVERPPYGYNYILGYCEQSYVNLI